MSPLLGKQFPISLLSLSLSVLLRVSFFNLKVEISSSSTTPQSTNYESSSKLTHIPSCPAAQSTHVSPPSPCRVRYCRNMISMDKIKLGIQEWWLLGKGASRNLLAICSYLSLKSIVLLPSTSTEQVCIQLQISHRQTNILCRYHDWAHEWPMRSIASGRWIHPFQFCRFAIAFQAQRFWARML